MSEIPESAFTRSLRLASLPLGVATRAATGVGKRVLGATSEQITAEFQAKTAEQIFQILGELKGGAMKMGQALSIFEAALPEEFAAPFRKSLTKLQDSAPPMPWNIVEEQIVAGLGSNWRSKFQEISQEPVAAASIGQVHKGIWHDGREVAVKIQYPGAAKALESDIKQASRIARLIAVMAPGVDIDPLLEEVQSKIIEELDYIKEAKYQRAFAAAFEGDEEVAIPHVLVSARNLIVTEWLEGTPMSRIIETGSQKERNRIGLLYERFLLSGPSRAGLLHADPHPGNYRYTPDGRLGVVDFGAVAVLPGGLPEAMGRLMRIAMSNDPIAIMEGLRSEGFLLENIEVSAEQLHDYLSPFTEPAKTETFTFSRDWMRQQFSRINDPRREEFTIGLKINLPPSYMLIHRVWLGSIGVLSQLECTIPARAEIERWVPGFIRV